MSEDIGAAPLDDYSEADDAPRSVFEVVLRFFEEVIPGIAMVALVVLVVSDVAMRYLADSPIVGVGELARLLFSWVVFLGASGACRRKLHVGFEIVRDRLAPRVAAVVNILGSTVLVVILGGVLHYGIRLTMNASSRSMELLGLPQSVLVASVPCGVALIIIRFIQQIIQNVVILRDGQPREDSSMSMPRTLI